MIKNPEIWQKFEEDYIKSQKVDIEENYRIFKMLYKEARRLGKIPTEDPLEGIEDKIRLARIMNYAKSNKENSEKTQ